MSQLLSVGPLQRIRLDLTTKCNLRCVYCAVSQSTYQAADMPRDLARLATTAIVDISHHHQLDAVHINGHGETTFLEGWTEVCRSLLERDLPLVLTTNLAKQYSQDEMEVLARMTIIAVSIDTCDADLLKRMRRKVDLRQIVTNIQMIRATSLRFGGGASPSFEFSCGLYDQNSLRIEDFARFAVALRIDSVGFWNLATWHHEEFPYENTDVQETDRAYPLDTLSPEELRPRLDAIQRALAILNAHGVGVQINGNFIETLANQCEQGYAREAPMNGLELPEGMTRDCIDPWTYAELDTNGDVKPCCARGSVGNLARASLPQILDDEPIRRLRADLLRGTTDRDCTACALKAPTKPDLLQNKVRILMQGRSLDHRQDKPRGSAAASASGKVVNLLSSAVVHMRDGRETTAWVQVAYALAMDPGITVGTANRDTIRTHLEKIVADTQSPSTLSSLAAVCRESGDRLSALALLRRYIQLAPHAPDRDHVLMSIIAETPPKKSTRAVLEDAWIRLRRKIQLRTRARLVISRLRPQ